MEINCIYFDSLDSTNTWSKKNYHGFDPKKLTIVIASQQTAGRGRYKRPWVSPGGQNIYSTFTFFMERRHPDIKNITQISAVSTIKALEELGFKPELKWPNDIQINKKKAGGILCEILSDGSQFVAMIGVGINVNMPPETINLIDQPVTSLMVERGKKFQVIHVIQLLQKHFADDIAQFLRKGFAPFLESYKQHLIYQKGDPLVIAGKNGTFQRIDDDGALIMSGEDGQEKKFFTD